MWKVMEMTFKYGQITLTWKLIINYNVCMLNPNFRYGGTVYMGLI